MRTIYQDQVHSLEILKDKDDIYYLVYCDTIVLKAKNVEKEMKIFKNLYNRIVNSRNEILRKIEEAQHESKH